MSPTSSRKSVPLSAISKRPTLRAIAPVKAPRSWPNNSLSSSPRGIAAQFNLTKILSRRAAEAMDRAGDQLFAGSCFSLDQHRCLIGRNCLDLVQNLPKPGAIAENVLELVFGANFVAKIEPLFGQPLLRLTEFAELQRVLERDRDLARYLPQELARRPQRTQRSADRAGAKLPSVRFPRMMGRKQPDWKPSAAFTLSAIGASDFGRLSEQHRLPGTVGRFRDWCPPSAGSSGPA